MNRAPFPSPSDVSLPHQQQQGASPSAPPHLSAVVPGGYPGAAYAPGYGPPAMAQHYSGQPPAGYPQHGGGLEHAVVTYPTLPAFSARDAAPPPPPPPPRGGYSPSGPPSRGPPPQRFEFAPEEPGGPQGAARFKVIALPGGDGGDIMDCIAQVGLDGVSLLDAAQRSTTLRVYPLESISRWQVRDGTILALWTKRAGEAEVCVSLSSDERTTRSMLDVLASSCLQLCELRGLDASEMMDSMGAGAGTNKLFNATPATQQAAPPTTGGVAMSVLGRVPRTPDPGAASVEYWRGGEHSGWLFKKGEHLSTWRRRWFVLKDGRLFWFATDKGLSPAVKPRGCIPLKACPGAKGVPLSEAGKPYAFELQGPDALATGCRHLAAESESEKDAWVAALGKAVTATGSGPGSSGGRSHDDWAAQLREGMQALSSVPSPRAAAAVAAPMVQVAGYGGGSGGDSGGHGGSHTGFQVHYDQTGRAFYFDPRTGRTQWDPPPGFA
jgi:hypothetical protein